MLVLNNETFNIKLLWICSVFRIEVKTWKLITGISGHMFQANFHPLVSWSVFHSLHYSLRGCWISRKTYCVVNHVKTTRGQHTAASGTKVLCMKDLSHYIGILYHRLGRDTWNHYYPNMYKEHCWSLIICVAAITYVWMICLCVILLLLENWVVFWYSKVYKWVHQDRWSWLRCFFVFFGDSNKKSCKLQSLSSGFE